MCCQFFRRHPAAVQGHRNAVAGKGIEKPRRVTCQQRALDFGAPPGGLDRRRLRGRGCGGCARLELGRQRVAPGAPLMAVVPLGDVWVEANFKEVQLRDMRIGQPVRLTADLYGSGVEYRGRVAGLAAGTGGAFALLPPQNATGNWIKVVQRLPVRIELDKKQLAAHPLRIGLSMEADVDVHDTRGPQLAKAPVKGPVYATRAFDEQAAAADARVREIIAANLGNGK